MKLFADEFDEYLVNTYLQKNPNLKNLSKVDRQIIALAHTLEREHHGNGNLSQSKYSKAMTVIGGATGKEFKDRRKTVKKSKTGRIHTEAKPLNDTGVRLAMFKKVIPFHFDDFMTLSQDQCMFILYCYIQNLFIKTKQNNFFFFISLHSIFL